MFLLPVLAFANSDNNKLRVTQLSEGVYQFVSYKMVKPWGLVGASGLVVVDGKEAHLIDTPWTTEATKELITWIENQGFSLRSAVVTHFHDDSSNDLPLLNNLKVTTYATTLTNQLLKSEQKQTSKIEISTDSAYLIEGVMEAFYPGAGHSKDNIVVWLPEQKILFGGCFVKNLRSKSLGYIGDASIGEWSESIDNVLKRYPDVQVVVPGHGKVGDINLLTHTKNLVATANKHKR